MTYSNKKHEFLCLPYIDWDLSCFHVERIRSKCRVCVNRVVIEDRLNMQHTIYLLKNKFSIPRNDKNSEMQSQNILENCNNL